MKQLIERQKERYTAWRTALDERQQRLLDTFLFLAIFTVLAGPLYVLLDSGWNAWPIRSVTSDIGAAVLRVIGVTAASTGPVITTPEIIVDVSRDSTGWKSVLALTALMIAARRPFRWTLTGIVVGTAVIAVANLLRITSTIYAVAVLGIPYELLHTVLWRWGLTVIVVLTWAIWMVRPTRAGRMLLRRIGRDDGTAT